MKTEKDILYCMTDGIPNENIKAQENQNPDKEEKTMERTCNNCVFNYVFDYDRNTGEVLGTITNGGRCQNPKSLHYEDDCGKVQVCGKWRQRKSAD